MSKAFTALAHAAEAAATEFIDLIAKDQAEVAAVAVEMIRAGKAVLRLDVQLTLPPGVRLMLSPTNEEGPPVELAVFGVEAEQPSAQGVSDRFWFFGQLAHWQPIH